MSKRVRQNGTLRSPLQVGRHCDYGQRSGLTVMMMMMIPMLTIPLKEEKNRIPAAPWSTLPVLLLGAPGAPSQDAHDAEAETLKVVVAAAAGGDELVLGQQLLFSNNTPRHFLNVF